MHRANKRCVIHLEQSSYFPTFCIQTLDLKQIIPSNWIILFVLTFEIPPLIPYFAFTNALQMPCFHHHSHVRLISKSLTFSTPGQHSELCLQTIPQLTIWYFFFVPPPCQKIFLMILFICSQTMSCNIYTGIWYIGILFEEDSSSNNKPQ
jgi:hypothetical protein